MQLWPDETGIAPVSSNSTIVKEHTDTVFGAVSDIAIRFKRVRVNHQPEPIGDVFRLVNLQQRAAAGQSPSESPATVPSAP